VQVIYAIPFVAVSLLAFVVFLSVRRLRPHALPALVAPVAFGGCSIFGLMLFALATDTCYDSLPHVIAIGASLVAYFGSGVAGAWLAIAIFQCARKHFTGAGGK
jgi:inner membrane protein involved in colicin E2 resistance